MSNLVTLLKKIGAALLEVCNEDTARTEAWWLLEHITGLTHVQLIGTDLILTLEQEQALDKALFERTQEYKPIQYIIGSVPFGSVDILTQPPLLIPRPETEEWVQWLIDTITQYKREPAHTTVPLRILDLCTGTGCIAIALAHAFPHAEVTGIDISPQAIECAQKNATRNNVENITLIQGDIFNLANSSHALPKHYLEHYYDIIVSNPPYLSHEEWENLDLSVKDWEDKIALMSEHEGLAHYEYIISHAHAWLKPASARQLSPDLPALVLEIGYTQAPAIIDLLTHHHFVNPIAHKDLAGNWRRVSAQST